MIGSIRGTLVEKQPPEILVDVAGVGYEIQMPMTSFYQLPAPGDEGGVRWEGGLCGRENTRVFCDSSRVLHPLVVSNPLGAGVAVGRRREGARVQQEGLEA